MGWSSGARFTDRRDAGQALARRLEHLSGEDVVVLGLPRGGVPVAFEVAQALRAPLDVLVVRKLGFPGHPEFAMGAIASGGVRVMNDEIPTEYLRRPVDVESVARAEQAGVMPPITRSFSSSSVITLPGSTRSGQ